ncbi:hypothetical protein EJ03DRAFT_386248 [Teratosphaeria nubilosa]|uniref:F-box domain-containing protein n=1 Tax=Teratosphaeria nubilosa TaxID=161662 RepID=A0A6G1KTQ6_9PEZI|nr:hypothetical protein EJ03DRAFT_386248 [Teratosphaeria nubilosa]
MEGRSLELYNSLKALMKMKAASDPLSDHITCAGWPYIEGSAHSIEMTTPNNRKILIPRSRRTLHNLQSSMPADQPVPRTTQAPPEGAAATMLGIAELRDMVLEYLPMADLVPLARVNRDWHDSIMDQPPRSIRRQMFLELAGPVVMPMQYGAPHSLDQKTPAYTALKHISINPRLQPKEEHHVRFAEYEDGKYQVLCILAGSLKHIPLIDLILESDPAAPNSLASRHCLKQFLTQPPITTISLVSGGHRDDRAHMFGERIDAWIYNPGGLRIDDVVEVLRGISLRRNVVFHWDGDVRIRDDARAMVAGTWFGFRVRRGAVVEWPSRRRSE